MPKMRRLNARGVEEFSAYLQRIREGADFQANPAILHVDEFSKRLEPAIDVERRQFANKLDAAAYLRTLLRGLDSPSITKDVGLWSWLALFWFDQLAPKRDDGKRRPREDYHYIPIENKDWRAERHLLAGPYRLYRDHGDRARLLLYAPLHQHGAFIYDLGFRRDLISSRGFLETLDLLYWDDRRRRPKRGATTESRPGNLRRFIAVLQQLDFNYDLYAMTAAEILALLPAEFDSWKPAPLLVPAK
jgi:hypothetical protein